MEFALQCNGTPLQLSKPTKFPTLLDLKRIPNKKYRNFNAHIVMVVVLHIATSNKSCHLFQEYYLQKCAFPLKSTENAST